MRYKIDSRNNKTYFLSIENTQFEDSGIHKLSARNIHGQADAIFNLNINCNYLLLKFSLIIF